MCANMTQQLNDVDVSRDQADPRRSEPRTPCEREIAFLPATDGNSAGEVLFNKAQVTDCSMHGMGLIMSKPVEAGQQILARLDVDRHPTLLLYTVRYCIPMQADQFRAGVRFTGFIANRFRGQLSSVMSSLALNGR